jgi:three-Cys-motif partner protein
MTSEFFNEARAHTRVKSQIVVTYFPAWAKIVSKPLKPGGSLVYLDLFSGPGRFGHQDERGEDSTPLLITRKVVADPRLSQIVRLVFNDKDGGHAERLREQLAHVPGIERLVFQPGVFSDEVGDQLAALFATAKLNPTFSFIDPFGYKGLTQDLIRALIKDWGSECVLFFNDSAVGRALLNPKVEDHVAALFGEQRAHELRGRLPGLQVRHRGRAVLDALEATLREAGAQFVLPFVLTATAPRRRRFHVVFATKHPKGYEIMKDVMRSLGRLRILSAGFWEIAFEDGSNPWLFPDEAVDELERKLPAHFAGQTLEVAEVHRRHHPKTPFIMSDYKAALRKLAAVARIEVRTAPGKVWRAGTFPDHLIVVFPPAGG